MSSSAFDSSPNHVGHAACPARSPRPRRSDHRSVLDDGALEDGVSAVQAVGLRAERVRLVVARHHDVVEPPQRRDDLIRIGPRSLACVAPDGQEAYPTAPSIWSSMRRLSSTAYSMGSSRVMGSMNPLTIIAVASASVRPRLIR